MRFWTRLVILQLLLLILPPLWASAQPKAVATVHGLTLYGTSAEFRYRHSCAGTLLNEYIEANYLMGKDGCTIRRMKNAVVVLRAIEKHPYDPIRIYDLRTGAAYAFSPYTDTFFNLRTGATAEQEVLALLVERCTR